MTMYFYFSDSICETFGYKPYMKNDFNYREQYMRMATTAWVEESDQIYIVKSDNKIGRRKIQDNELKDFMWAKLAAVEFT